MFWIHGGGNTTGTKDYYNFSKLSASKGIVVVVINYRLGPLGWFRHPAIQSLQDGIDKSSNFGTLDIIMALKWVQKNIHNFDGDKNNVTIFGESAGGHNVMTMLATPLSNGLFHKAISQSGYTTSYTAEQSLGVSSNNSVINDFGSLNVFSNASVSKITDSVIKNFNELDLQSQRRFLKNLKAEDFLSIYLELDKETFDYIPLVNRDGIVISNEGILSALGNKKYAKNVPVIFGSNKDELSLWLGVNNYFSERTYPFTRLIPIPKIELKNPELYKLWLSVRSEAWKLRGVDEPLLQLEKAGYKNIYAYRFDWDDQKKSFFADFPNMIGAAHGLEIAFLTTDYKFGPVSSYVYPKTDERDQMEETFLSAWSNFAKKGEPIIENAKVQWEKYTSSEQAFMVLDNLNQLRSISDKKNMDDILSFANTDMAFRDNVLVAGNYHGFNIYEIDHMGVPELLSSVVCPGGQGDVSIVDNLLIMSVEQTRSRVDCGLQGVSKEASPDRFRGIRIFDISNLSEPKQVGAVQTCRGSHTHSVVSGPDETGKIIVYNSCLLYTSPSPRDLSTSRMPSSA